MKVFLDACAIIYLIESHQPQGEKTRYLVTEITQNKGQLLVSTLSLLECRVIPLKTKDNELLAKYQQFFTSPYVQLVQLTDDVINNVAHLLKTLQWLILFSLIISVFLSALAVVTTRYQSRTLFIELQQLQQQRDKLNENWGQLQLELSTLSQPQRIETAAREQLLMRPPNRDETVILRPR